MENEINQNNAKSLQITNQLVQLIAEAISSSSTEDKMWVPLEKIKKYVESYYDGNPKDIAKFLVPTLRNLVVQELIIRKANTFCFMSSEAFQHSTLKEKKKICKSKKCKTNAKSQKKKKYYQRRSNLYLK